MNALELRGISFTYSKETILKIDSLDVPEKDFMVIIGPNGGGKSTLIKIILGLLKPQKGTVKLFGGNISSNLKKVGYVPQDSDHIKDFPVTALDTVIMGFYNISKSIPEKIKSSESILERLDMLEYKDRRLNELSTGQRQRVYLARALASQPKLLILDEPVSGIDPTGQNKILKIMKEEQHNSTVIFVSHDLKVIPGNATSVLCVNKSVHYHKGDELTPAILTSAYGDLSYMTLVKHECVCDSHKHEDSYDRTSPI